MKKLISVFHFISTVTFGQTLTIPPEVFQAVLNDPKFISEFQDQEPVLCDSSLFITHEKDTLDLTFNKRKTLTNPKTEDYCSSIDFSVANSTKKRWKINATANLSEYTFGKSSNKSYLKLKCTVTLKNEKYRIKGMKIDSFHRHASLL